MPDARGKQIDGIEEAAQLALRAYDWPGNVRELENTIERAVVLSSGGTISTRSLSALTAAASPAWNGLPSSDLHRNQEWVERETIRRALEASGGVKKDAAALIGISQRALSHYLAKHRIG